MPATLQVHRQAVPVGAVFHAPSNVTLGFQGARESFSVWYPSHEGPNCRYVIVGTGHEVGEEFTLVQSVVMPDGYHVFHLVRLTGKVAA